MTEVAAMPQNEITAPTGGNVASPKSPKDYKSFNNYITKMHKTDANRSIAGKAVEFLDDMIKKQIHYITELALICATNGKRKTINMDDVFLTVRAFHRDDQREQCMAFVQKALERFEENTDSGKALSKDGAARKPMSKAASAGLTIPPPRVRTIMDQTIDAMYPPSFQANRNDPTKLNKKSAIHVSDKTPVLIAAIIEQEFTEILKSITDGKVTKEKVYAAAKELGYQSLFPAEDASEA